MNYDYDYNELEAQDTIEELVTQLAAERDEARHAVRFLLDEVFGTNEHIDRDIELAHIEELAESWPKEE